MITPDEIRRKAEKLYPKFVKSWLRGESFFPYVVRFNRDLPDDIADTAAACRNLRNGSAEVLGYGYNVDWMRRNSPKYGDNEFPDRITLPTDDDLLRLIGKNDEFDGLVVGVELVRRELPELESWLSRSNNWKQLCRPVTEIRRLIAVADFFRRHPRPDCYAREIPVEADTKFIESNRPLLRRWLDEVLPPEAVRHDETVFNRRFYLKTADPLVRVRVLCDEVRRRAGLPFTDFGLPLTELASWTPPLCRVLIVENQIPLLTLPSLPDTIALGAMGNAAVILRDLPWLAERPLLYWGDLDVPGFQILNRLRRDFPAIRSVLMDVATLDDYRGSYAEGWTPSESQSIELPLLSIPESSAAESCFRDGIRLEQERLPLNHVNATLVSSVGLISPVDSWSRRT
ncbi:MAG: Wadjet anti-phage system protein JetD domain-containing protein [Planctomycetota bacterium]